MGWPQVTLLVLYGLGLVGSITRHEKPCTENAWARALGLAIQLALLYAGGFFG